ncbi:MAG: hypothetical protein M3R38_22795, partial [Actinomycetota bacterium]|nr:hypothetical protein [Actinomycetota bacterium]
MYARVNTFEGPSERVDEAIRTVREQVLPQLQRQGGFKGLTGMVEPQAGKVIGVTLWESEEALSASEQEADRLRRESAQAGEQTIAGVAGAKSSSSRCRVRGRSGGPIAIQRPGSNNPGPSSRRLFLYLPEANVLGSLASP